MHVSNKNCSIFLRCFGFWLCFWLGPHLRDRQRYFCHARGQNDQESDSAAASVKNSHENHECPDQKPQTGKPTRFPENTMAKTLWEIRESCDKTPAMLRWPKAFVFMGAAPKMIGFHEHLGSLRYLYIQLYTCLHQKWMILSNKCRYLAGVIGSLDPYLSLQSPQHAPWWQLTYGVAYEVPGVLLAGGGDETGEGWSRHFVSWRNWDN